VYARDYVSKASRGESKSDSESESESKESMKSLESVALGLNWLIDKVTYCTFDLIGFGFAFGPRWPSLALNGELKMLHGTCSICCYVIADRSAFGVAGTNSFWESQVTRLTSSFFITP